MIYWEGKNTLGNVFWSEDAETFKELFDILFEKKIIGDYETDPYVTAVLEKYEKTEEDAEFLDEDGEPDYGKIINFVTSHKLPDDEIWLLIAHENGNAYYQKFEREGEYGKRIEIGEEDFDEKGEFKFSPHLC